jgi:hypothetical protein
MNQSFILVLLLIVAAIGIPIYLKKRKNKATNQVISNRHNKDEVWKTIKQYLKDSNEYGKEIIDSYVAKRNDIDFINPNQAKINKKNKREEIKIRKWQFQQEKRANPQVKLLHPKPRDLYVVCFVTKDTHSSLIDQPRAIECEVINKKIDRKNYDRRILINRLLDYDKEME